MTTRTTGPLGLESLPHDDIELVTDVLVIGGGPAGTWAAIKAREAGAKVLLVDKGYCGTSGATAAAGTGVWFVPPLAEAREQAMASREGMNGWLSDRRWMRRVLDETYSRVPELDVVSYPFPVDDAGEPERGGLQGPDYMKRQRRRVIATGARIFDHSPVLELLVDADGSVAGARGLRRQTGETYRVIAGAVVVAAGGCAFLSRALGTNVDTGDSYLLGAEVGAEFSGMEFSNSYSLAPAMTSVTKSAYYFFSTFYREDGSVLEGAGSQRGRSVIARTLLDEPVFCQLDQIEPELWGVLRDMQPNFFQPFDRVGIDPFTQRFPVTLILEGTVRGTGGLRIVDDACSTTVPGLFAAGDAATRELICGAFTGGGSHNSAWAISSGTWAGQGAARHALAVGAAGGTRHIRGAGTAALRPSDNAGAPEEFRDVIATVQGEVQPYDKNYFRTGPGLAASLAVLDSTWIEVRRSLLGQGKDAFKAREAAAMVATARWMYRSALARTESRGMHKRDDFPALDPAQRHRMISGGLDHVWTDTESLDGVDSGMALVGAGGGQ